MRTSTPKRIVPDQLAHFLDGGAQVDVAQVGRHDRDAGLVGAVDLARADGWHDIGHGIQGDRPLALRIDDDAADVVDRGAILLAAARTSTSILRSRKL